MHGEFFGINSGSSEPVYARAAVLEEGAARPTLSADLLIDAYRRFKRGEDETDLILISSDASLALLVAMPPGLVLAGIVAEEEMRPGVATPTIPIISGLIDARQQISDGDLVILDPELGRILVEPDAEEFARLQSDRNRRPRLHIDASHVPARTQSGRTVSVWASVRTEQDLTDALQSGADGIVIESDSPYLDPAGPESGEIDPEEHAAILLAVADRIGGGELTIIADPTQIDPDVVFAVASRCALLWAFGTNTLFIPSSALRREIEQMYAECLSDDTTTRQYVPAMPSLCALTQDTNAFDLDLSAFDEVLVPVEIAATLTIAETFDLPKLRIFIDPELTSLPIAFAVGAAGVVVLPGKVLETKDFIRQQEY